MENQNLTYKNKTYKTEIALNSAKTRERRNQIKTLDRLIENKYKKTDGESKENKAERKRLTKEFNGLVDEEIAVKKAKKELAKDKLYEKTHLFSNEMFAKKQQTKIERTEKLLKAYELVNEFGVNLYD